MRLIRGTRVISGTAQAALNRSVRMMRNNTQLGRSLLGTPEHVGRTNKVWLLSRRFFALIILYVICCTCVAVAQTPQQKPTTKPANSDRLTSLVGYWHFEETLAEAIGPCAHAETRFEDVWLRPESNGKLSADSTVTYHYYLSCDGPPTEHDFTSKCVGDAYYDGDRLMLGLTKVSCTGDCGSSRSQVGLYIVDITDTDHFTRTYWGMPGKPQQFVRHKFPQ